MRVLTLAGALLLTTAALTATACGQTRPAGAATASGETVDPDSVRARADRGRMKGDTAAPVTIIEVSDFQCPYCAEFARTTYPRVDSAYIRTGRARLIYIHLPLSNHGEAFRAAEAAMCAGAQERFWDMHDRLFATQGEWSREADAVQRFERLAEELRLDMGQYRACMQGGHSASIVVGDAVQAAGAGISGTPSFILTSAAGQRALSGAVPFEDFAREVDALLAGPAGPAERPEQPE